MLLNHHLRCHEVFNLVSGVPFPGLRSQRRPLVILWNLYSILGDLMTVLLAAAELFSSYSSSVLNEFTFYLVCFSYLTVSVLRCFYFRIYKSQVTDAYVRLASVLKSNKYFKEDGVDFDVIYKKDSRLVNLISRCDVVMHLSVILLFTGPSLLMFYVSGYKDRLIVPKFVELTDEYTLLYGVVATLQFVAFLIASFRTATVFGFTISVINIQISNFKFLKKAMGVIADEATASLTEIKFGVETARKFRWWIEQHQESLRVSCQLTSLWGGLISLDYAYTVSGLLISSVAITTTHGEKKHAQNFAFILGVFAVLIKCYIFSLLSDRLKNETEKVSDTGFNYHVVLLPRHTRSTWKMVVARTRRPVLIKVFRTVHVNMSTFSTLVQTTFSYYLTLLQITYAKS